MSKRIGQCMEPRAVGNVKYFCVEPAGHQCEHRYVPHIDDVERLADRVRELEAERDALGAEVERLRGLLREVADALDHETATHEYVDLFHRIDAALAGEKP